MRRAGVKAGAALAIMGALAGRTPVRASGPPACAADGPAVEITGAVTTSDAKTYRLLPVDVLAGTTRIEVAYTWSDTAPAPPLPAPPSTPITQTVLDLGLWDADSTTSPAGFRGWSGSRMGLIHAGQPPVFVQADAATRGYLPGPIGPGVWNVEIGVGAVAPGGATYRVVVQCKATVTGVAAVADPVDAAHIARPGPGWYHGDLHMHGYHSNANAPSWPDFVTMTRAAKLDFLPVTDYVTTQHWNELGAIQRANPDLLIWPGREIITYYGHANTLGETPSVVEYRHGFGDITLRSIQEQAVADGALFQVNHPTIFPGPVFQNFCRGCEFTLGDEIDWTKVTTMEVVTGPAIAMAPDLDGRLPVTPVGRENPFIETAVRYWEDRLRAGYKVTAVSGSDSKGVEPDAAERRRRGYGSSATAVWAPELSRAALQGALRAGHAYVQARGVDASPTLEMTAQSVRGLTGMFGDVIADDAAIVTVRVHGGAGQMLRVVRDGDPMFAVRVDKDDFTFTFPAVHLPTDHGPLGTFWRVETFDEQSRTTIGNPIFLTGAPT